MPEQDLVYSNVTIDGRRLTWRELCEEKSQELSKLHRLQTFLLDLDRNEHGRHEGDVDVMDPEGTSQGNPLIQTGTVIGYSIGGRTYVMPARGERHDILAWGPHLRE